MKSAKSKTNLPNHPMSLTFAGFNMGWGGLLNRLGNITFPFIEQPMRFSFDHTSRPTAALPVLEIAGSFLPQGDYRGLGCGNSLEATIARGVATNKTSRGHSPRNTLCLNLKKRNSKPWVLVRVGQPGCGKDFEAFRSSGLAFKQLGAIVEQTNKFPQTKGSDGLFDNFFDRPDLVNISKSVNPS